MTSKYDDIINLPHHVSTKHAPMLAINRAAQFSPFAALTGYDNAVKETARLTEDRITLDEQMQEALSQKLQIIEKLLPEHPEVAITYFQPDKKKQGGAYLTATSAVKKLDEAERIVIMEDGKEIHINEIVRIEGQIFETI